jgi:ABC-type nickel/cobalt efflux system permease component RcnA
MKKSAAVMQLISVLLIVGYGTYNLFTGNFEQSMLTLPLLVVYYVFVVVRQKRVSSEGEEQSQDDR